MKKKVYAYLHTHWDLEWYRDHEDFNLRLLKVFDVVLDELEQNRAPFFYFDGQVIALLDYLKYREEKKDLILKLIKEKKLAIGPYLVSADSFLVSYIFMLKNLNYGLEISKNFHQEEFLGYMADIFGISNSAFLALKEKNIDKALIWRGVNHDKINNTCDFIKNSIKTTWLAQGYFNDFLNSDVDYQKKAQNLKSYIEKIEKYSKNSILLPIGADHLGVLKNANLEIQKINECLKDYEIVLTSPFEYFKNAKFDFETKELEFLDNSCTYVLKGTYSARIEQKIKNVLLENKIAKILEPLNKSLNLNYQKNLDIISKNLIKNHAHDGICGCSIDSVHKNLESRFHSAKCATEAILKNIIGDFKENFKIKGKTKEKLGVFNLGNREIKTIKVFAPYKIKNAQILSKKRAFEDDLFYDIYKIPVTEDIKEIYEQIIEIEGAKENSFSTVLIKKPEKKTFVTSNSLENDFLKFEIKDGKCFVLDKISKKVVEMKLQDTDDEGDSYNYALKGEYREFKLIKTKIVQNKDILSSLKLFFELPKIKLELEISLDNYSKFLKFNSLIDNKKKNHKVQISFLSSEKIQETLAQDAFGVVKRKHDPNYNMKDFMPAPKPKELETNSYPMQNFVLVNGISLLTKGLHEYEIFKNEIRICLLRAFGTISNPKNKARFVPAGPNLETISSQALKKTSQEFALLFGSEKESFETLDEFFQNSVFVLGEFKKEINFELLNLPKNCYFYGLDRGKEIYYKYSR